MIFGDGNVTRIAHQVNYLAEARVKRLVAFKNARPRHGLEKSSGDNAGRGKQVVNVREADVLVRVNQVGQQETHPGVARLRIGNQKRIVRIDRIVAARKIESEGALGSEFDLTEHL